MKHDNEQRMVLLEFSIAPKYRIVRRKKDHQSPIYVFEMYRRDAMGDVSWQHVRQIASEGPYTENCERFLCDRVYGLIREIESLQEQIEVLTRKHDGTKVP